MAKNAIIKGTFILTLTGLATRLIGFFFRMFLSHTFGAEQVGLYQLIFPIYTLCFSLSSAGIETALSRCVAREISRNKRKNADTFLYYALTISVTLSILLSILVRKYATFLSIYILGDLRCETLLSILSYALPFASIHSCICGYYLGQKCTKLPSLSQFVEQIVRVGTVFIIYLIFSNKEMELSIWSAVLGIVIGEGFSAIFCFRYFFTDSSKRVSLTSLWKSRSFGKELTVFAFPLTSTRILTNLLQSIESISIPLCLQQYGSSNAEALSIYGVLSGMALPCVLFPTALTNSISTMLLPTVAEIQAEDNLKRLNRLIRKVILFGFTFGSICGIIFISLGPVAGKLLFDSSLAGDFMQTLAWICPFLYMNSTLISIINGLGKASTSFTINVLSLSIRIVGVWIGIPSFGMKGYLWGLLASQLLTSVLCVLQLKRYLTSRTTKEHRLR